MVSYRDNVGTLSLDSYVKEMSRVWDFDSDRAMEVWEFQPDPISFSFTLGSSRLGIESLLLLLVLSMFLIGYILMLGILGFLA